MPSRIGVCFASVRLPGDPHVSALFQQLLALRAFDPVEEDLDIGVRVALSGDRVDRGDQRVGAVADVLLGGRDAVHGQQLKNDLLHLVDEDTNAFNKIMNAFGLPKKTDDEKAARSAAIQEATRFATEVPFQTMQKAFETFEVCRAMVEWGNPASVTDGGVGALAARSAVMGAHLNVKINASSLKDEAFKNDILSRAAAIEAAAIKEEAEILAIVNEKIGL